MDGIVHPLHRQSVCPSCQVQIPLWYVTLRNQCPRCGAGVRLRGSYFRALWFIAFLIAGLACMRSA